MGFWGLCSFGCVRDYAETYGANLLMLTCKSVIDNTMQRGLIAFALASLSVVLSIAGRF